MSDDLTTLSSLSEEQKKELLQWYAQIPESEEALDALTQTTGPVTHWNDVPELVVAVDALLMSIMGPDTGFQFANISQMYQHYRDLQNKHAPFAQYLGLHYFKFFVRKWLIKNDLPWEEKSEGRQNRVVIRFPNGYLRHHMTGFGKKQLSFFRDDKQIYTDKLIELDSVWNSAAYYADQPKFHRITDATANTDT
jgi:hypothetical protein